MILLVNFLAISLVCTFVQGDGQSGKRFYLEKSSEGNYQALLALFWKEDEGKMSAACELFIDEDLIKAVLESPNNRPVQTVSEKQMEGLVLHGCTEIVLVVDEEDKGTTPASNNKYAEYARTTNERRRRESSEETTEPMEAANAPSRKQTTTEATTTAGYDGIPVIFPGTKWCGAGDRAKSYDDLGLHQDTDRCCRAHDLCNDTLAPGETRNSLTNKSPFTKLSCQCDMDFYNCLNRVNSVTSNTIGNMYFNVLKRECYKEDYPNTKKCKKYTSFLKITCKEYEKNTKAPKEYQWVKAKKYKKIPFPGPITVTLPF